jgi:ABC-type glutathione transport system ATPase component
MSAPTADILDKKERATSEPVLSVDKLSLHVRRDDGARLKIVDDVSFRILPGQFFALVGESGSGKSTVLKAIAGLAPDWTGSIAVLGKPRTHGVDRAVARQCQMVFQDPYGRSIRARPSMRR